MINTKRLKQRMDEISKFGSIKIGEDVGLNRLAFSEAEKEARDYLLEIFKNLSLDIKIDAFGNTYATLKGEDSSLSAVTCGSHIDSVPNGGRFDGTLGVICGLEVLESIKESGEKHLRDITLIVFSAEESSRFKMATMGSKVVSAKLDENTLKNLKDKDGISAYEAATKFGCETTNLKDAVLKKGAFHSYIELHIEQGPVLENMQIPVGIVTGIAAPIRYEVIIKGKADHSGATPMNMRCDALLVASKIIIAANAFAKKQKTAVATVGYANALPGVLNVIPGSVTMGVDIRDIDENSLNLVDSELRCYIQNLSKELGFSYEIKELVKDKPVKLSQKIVEMLAKTCDEMGVKSLKLPSGAGHDAMNLIGIAEDIGMIFVPCKDGISHNIKESVDFKDVNSGASLLANTLIKLSNER
ncbi:MAG: M20 family metallo-hydrolase [Campylobacter sp.]|nr:M20 family metallo-hydrolase [Campylobacter sp.]